MTYYAEHSPRGFANEVNTYRFATKDARDKWVANIDYTWNASQWANAITAEKARKNVRYKGDSVTKSYNSDYIDGDQAIANELAEVQQRKVERKWMRECDDDMAEEYQQQLQNQNQ